METYTTKEEGSTFTDLFLRTIAVLGLIAVLLLGAWGIIQLAVALPGYFSNLSSGTLFTNTSVQKETLSVVAPASVTSEQTVQLSWAQKNNDTSAQYSYAVSYTCQSGLALGAPVPTGSYQGVACNTPFNYVNATTHMTVIPVTGSSTVSKQIVFTVTATKLSTGAITSTGYATTTVNPGAATTAVKPATTVKKTVTTTKPTTTYYPAATRAALYGYPDLATNVISVTPNGTRTTVQFAIANNGTNSVASGWTFNATLPINGSYTFASQPQQALYPGDKIVYNLSFDNTYGTTQGTYGYTGASSYTANGYTCNGYNCAQPTNYNNNYPYNNGGYNVGTVTITADPLNYIAELNKGNNAVSVTTPVY